MENLIQRVKGRIGKGVAVGLIGLALGTSVPAIANADKTDDFFRALRMIEGVTDRVQDRMDEQQQEQQQNQQQAQAQQDQQAQTDAQTQEQYSEQQLQKEREDIQKYQDQLPKNQIHYFACNSITGDRWVYPQDYVGIKSVFKVSEPLILVDYDPLNKKGDVEKVDVYGTNGKLIPNIKDITIPGDGLPWEIGTRDGTNRLTKYLVDYGGGYGDYRAVFFSNDNTDSVGETDFTITPD